MRNAIDPRQTVTVTRDALRNPTQFHVWLRTNTRVKINADTRALHDPPPNDILVPITYTYTYIPIGQSLIIFDHYFRKSSTYG